jgi:signal transduction histidine kinase/DNA-binding NarL/FixJ family response regulator/predicted RNA-binding protein with RPS1 domain
MHLSAETTTVYRLAQAVSAHVERVFPFGVFVRMPDGSEAYVRRRELTQDGALPPEEVVSVGQEIQAVVLVLPGSGSRLELSVRRAEPDPWEALARTLGVQHTITATVKNLSAQGVWVQIVPGVDGFIPRSELAPWPVQEPAEMLWVGDQVKAMITRLDRPTRRVRLSIQKQMLHEAQVHRITQKLRTDEPVAEALPESEEIDPKFDEPVDLQGLGRVLVIDDDDGVRDGLVTWLQSQGCQAEGAARSQGGIDRARQVEYGLFMVDLDLAGQDGLELIRALGQVQPDTPVAVISIPEWIAERSHDLEDLAVAEVFTKPLDLDEVADTLARLAQGESVGPFRIHTAGSPEETSSAFQRLAHTMRSGAPLETRLEAALKELVRLSRAEMGVLFHLDPISQQVEVAARAGLRTIDQDAVYGLAQSPVKDLIIAGGDAFEPRLTPHVRRRFEKLLAAIDFQSCLGVPVPALGRVEHALFLFHREPDAFNRFRLRDAQATATLLGVALESQALEERIQAISPFLMSGQLAAGFGHDVFNKMTGLELQVRNMRTSCAAQTGTEAIGTPGQLPSCIQAVQDMEQVLDTTLDLRRTVDAFQELVRAEVQVLLDVNQVVARSILLLRSTAQRSKVQIEMDPDPDLPPVVGSPVRLQQAFLNVMLNAVQHTAHKRAQWPKGDSRLLITTCMVPGNESPLQVRFTDTGPGIHRKLWDRIFALGFSTRSGGSGLGLFIARSLVESMGGKIAVEQSTIPIGTTFLVELPVAAGAEV